MNGCCCQQQQRTNRAVDESEFTPYKEGYGKTLLTGYARIEGWAVGIVANQRKVVKNAKGEMQFGGVIYSDAADKATRFIANCNQKKIPLVFLQDVFGLVMITPSLEYPVSIKPWNILLVFLTISILGIIASKLASSRIDNKLVRLNQANW